MENKTLQEIHSFWKHPSADNLPETYLDGDEISAFLNGCIEEYCKNLDKQDKILEIGCNCGRNIFHFQRAGYPNVEGIEINPAAITLYYTSIPGNAEILEGPAESICPRLGDNSFALVYTVAVLQHIHPDSESLFEDMARISSKYIVIIENENKKKISWRFWARNYLTIFKKLGMKQLKSIKCTDIKGLNKNYILRITL